MKHLVMLTLLCLAMSAGGSESQKLHRFEQALWAKEHMLEQEHAQLKSRQERVQILLQTARELVGSSQPPYYFADRDYVLKEQFDRQINLLQSAEEKYSVLIAALQQELLVISTRRQAVSWRLKVVSANVNSSNTVLGR